MNTWKGPPPRAHAGGSNCRYVLVRLLAHRRVPKLVFAAVAAVACALAAMPAGHVSAASSSVVVSMDVPSATTLTPSCSATTATSFGVVQPGTPATTATGAGACSVSWTSSNDGTSLRMMQSDRTGVAMAAASQVWNANRDPNSSTIHGIHAASTTSVMASAQDGRVYRSGNGGSSWVMDQLPTGHWMFDIDSAPAAPDSWVVVGGGNEIYSSTNGISSLPAAATWTSRSAALLAAGWPSGNNINGVAMISASNWIVAGSNGWVAYTTNTGSTWTAYQLTGQEEVTDIDAVSATEYVATASGKLFRTTTSGVNAAAWTAISPTNGNLQYLSELSVADATHVYAIGRDSSSYMWNGTTFAQSSTGGPSRQAMRIMAIAAPTAAPAAPIALGEQGAAWRSADSGATWNRGILPSASWFQASTAPSALVAYAGALNGDIAKTVDGGATWTLVRSSPATASLIAVDADPSSGRTAIAVGTGGLATRSTDKGGTWADLTTGTSQDLLDVEFASSTQLWAVGKNGTILRSNNGGSSWSPQSSGVTEHLRAIHARSPSRAWVVGDNGTILATVNGGVSWTVQSSGTSQDLTQIASLSDLNAVAMGGDGRIRRTIDGGANWITPSGQSGAQWEGLVAVGPSTYLGFSYFGGVYRSADGGDTWSYLRSAKTGIGDVDASGSLIVVNFWDTGSISTDGGATWNYSDNDSTWGASGLAAVDANSMYLAHAKGSMWTTDEDAAATRQLSDYAGGANFGSANTTSTFGVCLQNFSGTTLGAGWTVDGGTCTASDTDPWRPLATTPVEVGTTSMGVTGNATFVWGMRPRLNQPAARYSAGVTFEAISTTP
ncbi:MAG: hypothetical protein JWM86_426 [Thermoleophilia bacterium]|nr:hypothetical protein [Thermoleophilia bacterium]